MIRSATRILLTFLCVLCVVAWTDSARARSFTVKNVLIKNPDDPGDTLQESELDEFFNRARCLCQTVFPVKFELNQNASGDSRSFLAVAGEGDCITDDQVDEELCSKLSLAFSEMEQVTVDEMNGDFAADLLISDADCAESGSDTITLAIFAENENVWSELGDNQATYRRDVDPPTRPTRSADPAAGEKSATVRFAVAEDSKDDTKHYQVLCVKMTEDGEQVAGPWGGAPPSAARFMTSEGLCNKADPGFGGSGSGDSADAGVAVADAGSEATDGLNSAGDPVPPTDLLDTANNSYVCSERLASDGSHTIKGLVNGTTYGFYVVAIDQSQNPSEPRWLGTTTPVPSEDLWERYRRLGGQGDGGYGCTVGSRSCSGVGGLLSLLFVLVWYARRRRRSPRAEPKGTRQ